MNNIKLVAFDLDGTTVAMGGTTASDRFCSSVQEGLLHGVVFAPFTGRTMTTIPEKILEIPGLRYISYSNGAGIYDTVSKGFIYKELMDLDTCVDILHYLAPYNLPVMIFSDGRIVMDRSIYDGSEHTPLPPHHKKSVEKGTAIIVDNMEKYLLEFKPNVDKVNIVRVTGEVRTKIFSDLANNDKICAVSSGGLNLEINGINTNKGNALRFLAAHLGIDLQNVMALGDNDNDVKMLETAGLGVAMENASDAAKSAADYITEAQDKDGAAIAIERFVLGQCTVTL